MSSVLATINGLPAFEDLVRDVLAHCPGNWETTSHADALLAGTICLRSMLPDTEEGETATASQLHVIDATPPTLASGLILVALSSGRLGLNSSPLTLDGGLVPASLTWDL